MSRKIGGPRKRYISFRHQEQRKTGYLTLTLHEYLVALIPDALSDTNLETTRTYGPVPQNQGRGYVKTNLCWKYELQYK